MRYKPSNTIFVPRLAHINLESILLFYCISILGVSIFYAAPLPRTRIQQVAIFLPNAVDLEVVLERAVNLRIILKALDTSINRLHRSLRRHHWLILWLRLDLHFPPDRPLPQLRCVVPDHRELTRDLLCRFRAPDRDIEPHFQKGPVNRALALEDEEPELPRVDRDILAQPRDPAHEAPLPVVVVSPDAECLDRGERVDERLHPLVPLILVHRTAKRDPQAPVLDLVVICEKLEEVRE